MVRCLCFPPSIWGRRADSDTRRKAVTIQTPTLPLALATLTIAEPRPKGGALGAGLGRLASSVCRPDLPFTEPAALAYGDIMSAALRQGRSMTAPDGMIAAIARLNGGAWRPGTCRTSKRQTSNSSVRGISEAARRRAATRVLRDLPSPPSLEWAKLPRNYRESGMSARGAGPARHIMSASTD
jgi:hypothetical protein